MTLKQTAESAMQGATVSTADNFETQIKLGNILYAAGDFKPAADCYLKALAARPDAADAYINLANVLRLMGAVDEAMVTLRHALTLRPDYHVAWCNLGNVLKDTGDLQEAIACYRRAIELRPGDAISHSNLVYAMLYDPTYDTTAILHESLRWNVMHARGLNAQIRPHGNDRSPDRRLRVGYVSPDFREHCQSLFTIPLLSRHDHQQFEIFCYSSVARPDPMTERIKGHADVWRNFVSLSDQAAAQIVRNDEIDILVDLTMHMSSGRPLLFARKPAPVQVAWLAYPGTTGIAAMDYRLTDPHLDPPGDSDLAYSETSVRLADSFWCYDPLIREPMPSPLPALSTGRITFGCLNNFCKVTDVTLDLWGKVMSAVADSRLILLSPLGRHRQRVLHRLGEKNIDPARVQFVEFQRRPQYLQTYHQIDLGLDTLPYNGHTTSLDSFWMGVPVVTRIGSTAVGRAGWCQLHNLDLPELASRTDEEFVQIAVNLARDLPRLSELRSGLRDRMCRSPLTDGKRFTHNIEAAYRQMWHRWCKMATT